jgi:hypothetical protein
MLFSESIINTPEEAVMQIAFLQLTVTLVQILTETRQLLWEIIVRRYILSPL